MRYDSKKVERFIEAIIQDRAGNENSSITDIDSIISMLTSLAAERDKLQIRIDTIIPQSDELLAALKNAHELIESQAEQWEDYTRGRGYYENEKEIAAHNVEYKAVIASAKGGAA